jgi:hypothetical protein
VSFKIVPAVKLIDKIEHFDNSLFTHYNIPNCNRSKQVYYTLKTIEKCTFKNIQVILVNDSDIDPIKKEELKKYPFYIDFIIITPTEKKNETNKNLFINSITMF